MSPLARYLFVRDLPHSTVAPPEKLILYTLAARADMHGASYPGQARIAQDTGLSVRTVRRALTRLIALGLLARYRRFKKSNIYALTFQEYDDRLFALTGYRIGWPLPKTTDRLN